MRGILHRHPPAPDHRGISPAHAGNTRLGPRRRRGPRDQPRTCGEYQRRTRRTRLRFGSAPHMRGILSRLSVSRRGRGISPAHAGNTDPASFMPWIALDQPRTCGEYNAAQLRAAYSPGSAPHMRGIPPPHGGRHLCVRISPAHAGNTGGVSAPPPRISPAHAGNTGVVNPRWIGAADQPRTCGEYRRYYAPRSCRAGSAPHMRGIHFISPFGWFGLGISPAHAGNTGGVARRYHMCGSAPHMRGIHHLGWYPEQLPRISPAHAGNTLQSGYTGRVQWDQPRTCGEYSTVRSGRLNTPGSAPHMRGIPRARGSSA